MPSRPSSALLSQVGRPLGPRVRTTARLVWGCLAFAVACGEVQVQPVSSDAATDALADGASGNLAPKVKITSPSNGAVLSPGQTVHFAATLSDDGDSPDKLQVTWSLGNGTVLQQGKGDASGASEFDTQDLPLGAVKVLCQATDSQGAIGAAEVVLLVNSPPGAPAIDIVPAAPTTTDDLMVQLVTPASDPDRSASELSYSYAWFKNDQPTAYTDKVLPAAATTKGDKWTVQVRAKDVKAEGAEATATVTIANAPPKAPVLQVAPAAVDLLSDVSCTMVQPAIDEDGDTLSYTWIWQVGSYTNPAVDAQSTKVQLLKSAATKAAVVKAGDVLSCAVMVKDSDGAASVQVTSPTVVVAAFDTCASQFNPCDAVATCQNTDTLEPLCACPAGYLGDGKVCLDVDECAAGGSCSADAICSNTAGAYSCSCKKGFAGDGKACSDIDECALSTDGCDLSADCSNTQGSYVCSCAAGYAKTPSQAAGLACAQKLCTKDWAACQQDKLCSQVMDCSKTCTTDACSGACAATLLPAGATVTDVPALAALWGCIAQSGCGNDYGFACSDIDECATANGGCSPSATCQNTPGSLTCTCKKGFAGDGQTCEDIDECASNNGGCSTEAVCQNYEGGRFCVCKSGFAGTGEVCDDVDECATGKANCDANATCQNSKGSFSCACKPGFEGTGTACNDIDECATGKLVCGSNSKCVNQPGSATCACLPGFEGDAVKGCSDIDECKTGAAKCLTAVQNGTCSNTAGSFQCGCTAGYSGDGVTYCTQLVDKCKTNNGGCAATAKCTFQPLLNSVTCACLPGFTGNGQTCTDINECATSNGGCSPNALCSNAQGSFSCACKSGYSGDGKTCTDINECASNNGGCSNLAQCLNSPAGSFTCKCVSGYQGDGKTCSDINECLTNNGGCSVDATCSNSVGSFSCACKPGFTGTGKTCTDINECASNNGGCSVNATCSNTAGGFACTCKAGYQGDGKTCTDIDECPPVNFSWQFGTQGLGPWQLSAPSVAGSDVGWKLQGGTLYYGNSAGTSFDTPGNKNSGTAVGAPIVFSNFPQHRLTFDVYFDTEMGGGYDNLNLNLLTGGQQITVWSKSGKNLPLKQWQTITVTVPGYAGQIGQAQFAFDTIDSVANMGSGVRIKGLLIQGAGSPCDANATCSNSPGSFSCACQAGFSGDGKKCLALGSDSLAPADSCLQLQQLGKANGTYWIKTPAGPKQLVCESGWARISFDTFEGSPGAWAPAGLSACGGLGGMLGGYNLAGAGTKLSTVLDNLPVHKQLRVTGNYLALDTWDGEKGWLQVDGVQAWAQPFATLATGSQCGVTPYGEQSVYLGPIVVHSATKATVVFGSDLNEPPSNESFGIDNIVISVQ
jgi:hypothetical protein